MIKKILKLAINLVIIGLVFSILTFLEFDVLSLWAKLLILVGIIVAFACSYIFKYYNLTILSRLSYSIYIIACIVFIAYYFMYLLNILYIFSSVTTLKNYIISTQEKGIVIYILLQLAQVVFLPIPASVICIVGSLIYGPLLGGIYCCIGVLIGSYLSFILGKTFGYKLVSWIVGKDNTDKYSAILRNRGGFFLGLAFLLPMFPDDILCLIAGISNMSFKKFFLITLITRPIGVICMAYFGSGSLIPFTGWGIYVWIAILVLAVALVYVTYRWQNEMQDWILNKVFRKKVLKTKNL